MDLDFDDEAAPAAKAGARFKPKGRPAPKKKQVSVSTSQPTLATNVVAKEPQGKDSVLASVSETTVPESGTISQSTPGTLLEENVDVISREVSGFQKPSILRSCTKVVSEGGECDDGMEVAPAIHEDSETPATDGDIHAQSERMQIEEPECHLDMETLDIVQEEGTSSSYVQHTGKLQPKPRVLETVIEEPESHYSVDDNGYYSMGTNESEPVGSRNNVDSNTTVYGVQEEDVNIPEIPRETVMEAHGEQVVSSSTNNIVEEEQTGRGRKKGKSKKAATRKRKTTSEEEPNKSSENPEKKKFKHTSRRQKKRTLEKELLETPDEEIRFLPIRDMLRLVEYKEWLEKKEAKEAPVVPPSQETNTNTSENQYYSQGFDEEDEFAMEEGENQEINVVKPDSPVNYQTYMNKTSRSRWSKEDTELFYEGIREFGSNLSMVQQLFPNRTREQIKLKFKLEERKHPLQINDALSSRSKSLVHFQNVIKKLQQEAAAAKQAEEEEEREETEAGAEAETTDVPDNEEPPNSGVKESDGGDLENGVKTDGGDEYDNEGDDDDFWNSYKSNM